MAVNGKCHNKNINKSKYDTQKVFLRARRLPSLANTKVFEEDVQNLVHLHSTSNATDGRGRVPQVLGSKDNLIL